MLEGFWKGFNIAKKAKRRGRAPVSKSKKSLSKSISTMNVAQLRAHVDNLQGVLERNVTEQRSYFERQLAELGGYVSKKVATAYNAISLEGRKRKRAKAKPKYQSKKD